MKRNALIKADTLTSRRKERRRLEREYEFARDGRPASKNDLGQPGKRKAVPSDPEKARRIKFQLDRWVVNPDEDDQIKGQS